MRIEAVPVRELVQDDQTGNWRSTGPDPHFLLRPAKDVNLPNGWLHLKIPLEFHGGASRPRLYWDDGNGYSEQRVYLLPLPKGGRVTAVLPFPPTLQGLRLDPMEREGTFALGTISARPLSRFGVAFLLVSPYLGRMVRNPRFYFGVARELLWLWRIKGSTGVQGALRHLALAGNGTAVRAHIYARTRHAHNGHGPASALSPSGRAVGFSLPVRKGDQKQQIGIGLVEHFGDIVACEPVVRYLKKQYSDAEITWVVQRRFREIVDANPCIDRTIAVDCLTDWIKLRAHAVFDRIIDLHVNERICQNCGIPLMKTEGNPAITGNNYFNHGSILESLAIGAGLPPLTDGPKVYIPESAVTTVDALDLPQTFIVVHCRSNEPAKDWEGPNWSRLVSWLQNEGELQVVEIGLQPAVAVDIDLCGRTSILETAEVIGRARLFIGIDSGPAHLANAVGTPGVVLLGRVGPFNKYTPFTGGYADGSKATLVRNEKGPASGLAFEPVQEAVARRLELGEASVASAKQAPTDSPVAIGMFATARASKSVAAVGGQDFPRLLAFHLPQFHPIPENDTAWGKGFTEWRNVGKARPMFEEQYQPRLPGELGYYDLRLPEILERQAELAREHAVHGFCFYNYWFQGKRLLHLPLDTMIRRKRPDFPFCFCWANENWTRRWDGMEKEIIIRQNHDPDDDIRFIRHLIPMFEDPRYIRVNGKSLLLIYRTELFPDPLRTADRWREEVLKAGLGDLFLVRCEGFDPFTNPVDIGFDASYEVPTFILPDDLRISNLAALSPVEGFSGRVFDYKKIVQFYSERPEAPFRRFKTAMLAWDNTPRHGNNAVIFHGVTPEQYGEWLHNCLQFTMQKFPPGERVVFIHAWNEWAEGSYLEPDLKFGRAFLETTRSVQATFQNRTEII